MDKQDIALKVSSLSGKRITMTTERTKKDVVITIPYLPEVEKDKPKFASRGVIKVVVPPSKYTATKNMITKYLEDLFLKELSNADTNTGNGGRSNSGRVKKEPTTRDNEGTGGEGSLPVRNSGGRDKPSKSSGDRLPVIDVAKSNSKDPGASSKKGD
jgi:hypothetical protein